MELLIEGPLDYSEGKEWKKRYFVMKYEIGSGLRYIEIYKEKNWKKQLPRHVVNLHPGYEVNRVKNDPKKKYVFALKTTDHSLNLATEDENVMNQWLATFEEYNLVKSFCVQPQDTPTMVRIEAVYPCHLQMVHSEVRLVSAMDGKLLGLWPFKCIRRYKFTGNVFCIEAGRKAPTGEGLFEFISTECPEIYRVMDTIIRAKAGDSTSQRLGTSQKLPQRAVEKEPARRVMSDATPAHRTKTIDYQYDYATTTDFPGQGGARPASIVPPPPRVLPVPSPSVPRRDVPARVKEPQYDELTPSAEQSYDSLHFKDSVDVSSSPPSYDTMSFKKQSGGQQAPNVMGYDKLQFGKAKRPSRNNSSSSLDDDTLKPSADDTYDMLNHLSVVEQPKKAPEEAIYNTLDSGQATDPHTYNTLGEQTPYNTLGEETCYNTLSETTSYNTLSETTSYNTLGEALTRTGSDVDSGDTYDHIGNATRLPSVKSAAVNEADKSMPPAKPPPRKKPLGKPKEGVRKPERPTRQKPFTKSPSIEETTEVSNSPPRQSMRDVIQQRTASTGEEGDGYASVDHDYASIDYSKVSVFDPSNNVPNVYAEPIDVPTKVDIPAKPPMTSTSPIKPPKPKRSPRPMKNLFKKNTTATATKPAVKQKPSPADTEENSFANELKKKLEAKKGPVKEAKPKEDDIYTEVDENVQSELNV